MKILLFVLLLFIGVTAMVSGIMLMAKPDGSFFRLPTDVLYDTPFKNFLLPGIILAFAVGGTNLYALFYQIRNHPRRYGWAITGGVLITGWIVVQMILLHTVNWFHFVYIAAGVLVMLIAWQLKGKWIV